MWFNLTLFSAGLLGLIVLFFVKTLEQKRSLPVRIAAARRKGDALVTERWNRFKEMLRFRARRFFEQSRSFFKASIRETGERLYAFLHSFSVRLGEYLKRNGAGEFGNGDASSYMKNMLEYKREATKNNGEEKAT